MAEGKLIDTWYYEYKGIDTPDTELREDENGDIIEPKKVVRPIKVPIQFRLEKTFDKDQKPPLETKSVSFFLVCEKPEFRLQGTDIEALRVAMWEKLDEHFNIKWEMFYKVEIRESRVYSGIGEGLQFTYDTVYKGTAWDGTEIMREDAWKGEKLSPWPGRFTDKNGNVLALIPYNQDNRKSLQEFGKKIVQLRECLATFLKPELIMQTLQNLNAMQLISAPPVEEDEASQENKEPLEVEAEEVNTVED